MEALVGRPQGIHLGYGTDPVVFALPSSQILFQLENVIDLTDVASATDIFHDLTPITVDDALAMATYEGDRYSAEYLFTVDVFIQLVVGL